MSARASKASSRGGYTRDATRIFHREWLGLVQPIEGLVFSVPALDEAPVPATRADITPFFRSFLIETAHGLALKDVGAFFRDFLGYAQTGALVSRDDLPKELAFYAPESRQEVRPSFAIARSLPKASEEDDPFAIFRNADEDTHEQASDAPDAAVSLSPHIALVWDLGDDCADATALVLDAPEDVTGAWRYPPTVKFERLLRHAGVPVGFVTNRRHLRLIFAPQGEATSHLTFRLEELAEPAGRSITLALELLFHARRTYSASAKNTFEGLLIESRLRQADVTESLAAQVLEAVERLLEGFEAAAARDVTGERIDWLRHAMEAGQVYEGVLNVVLRLVFLLYAEDRSLLPVGHPTYAAHLSVLGLYERLVRDEGAHPESMAQRHGAYGALISLFRALYFGVKHGSLVLPSRQGRLFDPSVFPFLEGGLPGWTAAVSLPEDRARVRLPSVDDGTLYEVLHRLIVLDGQRISYRDLSVEQIGAVYESLMGFTVERMEGPAVRLGDSGYWVHIEILCKSSKSEREKVLGERCELSKAGIKNVLEALSAGGDDEAIADAIVERTRGKADRTRHRARRGQLVLQPTASRRSTGSHYTPRSLSEKVVRRTLEPIFACLAAASETGSPTASQLLQLKVCDPAMGSGAFLVEACRALGEAVVEAWRKSGELTSILEKEGDALLHAKRLVAQRCLLGVDKNAAAVELAKLSLWLETLSGEKPFTFLDHVLRHGDSLVGLDLEQVRAFHWAPKKQMPTVATLMKQALEEMREHRDAIHALADAEDEDTQREKRRLLTLANQAMERVKLVADVCVGAFFAHGKEAARNKEREARLEVVGAFLQGDEGARAQLEEWALTIRQQHAPFHWHLEFPEVFFLERPDPLEGGKTNGAAYVDAFVGNPPFLGGSSISSNYGEAYRDWLLALHEGSHGNADLSAHFFRRAARLLGAHGTIGLISTNTISQGDTRSTGLQHLVNRDNFLIYDATRSMMWPGVAAVSVSIVHLGKGTPATKVGALKLDSIGVNAINSQLLSSAERSDSVALRSNAGSSFLGSKIYGQGFTLTPEERDALIAEDPKNGERIFPYLGGQEVNTSPTQSHDRFVISFGQMSLEEAAQWPDLIDIVRAKVKPERDTNNRDVRRIYWWRFGEVAPALYEAIAPLERCLVTARVSKYLMFCAQPTGRILSEQLYVFPFEAHSSFAILQSRIHEPWARLLSSSMKNDLRYSASDCFETFPFPVPDPRTVIPSLEAIGEALYEARAAYMVRTQQGLTQTYNRLKDAACDEPDILHLRTLHEEMDREVLAAYGWQDLQVPPFCPKDASEQKALQTFGDAVIDRLFVLNAERAKEEARLGAGKVKKEVKVVKAKKAGGQGGLFGDEG